MTTGFDAMPSRRLCPGGRASLVGALVALVLTAACGSGAPQAGAAASAAGGGMPPMGVELVPVSPKPVDKISDFVGVVKSRH